MKRENVTQARGREGWLALAHVKESTYLREQREQREQRGQREQQGGGSSGGKPPFPTTSLLRTSRITHHVSLITFHSSRFTHHVSQHHVSRITHHLSPVPLHKSERVGQNVMDANSCSLLRLV